MAGELWPGVTGVAAGEGGAEFWVEALPETGEVLGGLDGAVVGCEEVDDQRCLAGADAGGLGHAVEVLKA